MTVARFTPPPRATSPAQLGGLKKVLRKAAGPVLAVAAVASGNPQLALPAYQAGSAATKKKPKVQAPVQPVEPPGLLDNLAPADRQVLLIGGAVVGTLLVSKLLLGRK